MDTGVGNQSSTAPLNVCILWHMHQPDYRDPVSGQTLLPWTWLHGVKDYGEMLETIAETQARVTVNLVPSLLEQLERYVAGEDRDRWLEILSHDPGELSYEERVFMVKQFFSVNEETQVYTHRRYHQLFLQRGSHPEESAATFSDQDLLDLQVWFLLAWTGSHLRRKQPLIGYLLSQGENFSVSQKQELIMCCNEELQRVLTFHRELEAAGLIEISITPYAHPILPLLCNLQTAQEPSPGLPLPATTFRYPDDARLQIREGLATANRIFGQRERGMWPSEGSVSQEAVQLMREEGARWAATDEDILARSLDNGLGNRSLLYQVYSYDGLPLLFRDRELSDRIGFLYATWGTDEAVSDLMRRLKQISGMAPGGTVAIILDGENCWERYPDNGYPFLRDFYQGVNAAEDMQLATISEVLETTTPTPLNRLAAGSWIRSDFTTWIGHPEENMAWELLSQTRRELFNDEIQQALAHPDQPLSELVRELLRAEGSDWFWWYGDEHVTAQADIFDRLFRLHLEGLYHLKQMPVPARINQAIKPVFKKVTGFEPTTCFTPSIDGRVGDYFEWLSAGLIDLASGGAMYSSRDGLDSLYYGYDEENLYFRIDEAELLGRLCREKGHFELRITAKKLFYARYTFADGLLWVCSDNQPLGQGQGSCNQVLEMAIPLDLLGLTVGDSVNLTCHAVRDGRENGRWPAEGHAGLCYRGQTLDENNWSV